MAAEGGQDILLGRRRRAARARGRRATSEGRDVSPTSTSATASAIDRSWYRASGLRASESHRVEFHDTPVLAVLGGADELLREPWFSRDAVRTAATWAGIADCILAGDASSAIGERRSTSCALHAARAGCAWRRRRSTVGSSTRWRDSATGMAGPRSRRQTSDQDRGDWRTRGRRRMPRGDRRRGARRSRAEAARVCGSRALVGGGALDRARRDLDLFLLQHRLDPKLVELGAQRAASG